MLVDARLAREGDEGVAELRQGSLMERNAADAGISGLAADRRRESRARLPPWRKRELELDPDNGRASPEGRPGPPSSKSPLG